MTSREEIERLLNQTGRTLEGLPPGHNPYKIGETEKAYRFADRSVDTYSMANHILHQSDVIELLVGALRDSEPKRVYGNCHHCKNGTYSCPITQMGGTLIRYASFCDECGRDLRPVMREMYRREK